jgi:hypothetical protein
MISKRVVVYGPRFGDKELDMVEHFVDNLIKAAQKSYFEQQQPGIYIEWNDKNEYRYDNAFLIWIFTEDQPEPPKYHLRVVLDQHLLEECHAKSILEKVYQMK